jgi:hypothetical protein
MCIMLDGKFSPPPDIIEQVNGEFGKDRQSRKEMTQTDSIIRKQLIELLRGENAHMTFSQAVADFPLQAANQQPPNVPYTPWQLLEHIRIAQWDILEFIRDPDHESPDWPKGYWPEEGEQADQARWQQSIDQYVADRRALEAIVRDASTDLTAPIPHAQDYTILREILVVSDHSAYHIGEFATLRQVMGTWS